MDVIEKDELVYRGDDVAIALPLDAVGLEVGDAVADFNYALNSLGLET